MIHPTLWATIKAYIQRHTEVRNMPSLSITVPGASPEDLRRGIAAAESFFAAVRISPQQAAVAAFAREGWHATSLQADAAIDTSSEAADAWDEADRIAVEACCAGWKRGRPDTAQLCIRGLAEEVAHEAASQAANRHRT